jgi:hypothetical protein
MTIRRSLGPPQFHHNCVAVYGVRWRSTAVSALRKPLRFGLWRSVAVNHRFQDGSENHGAPGSNPGPATIKMGVLQVKRPRTEAEAASAHHKDTTTSCAGAAGGEVRTWPRIAQRGPAYHVRDTLPLYPLDRRGSVHSCSQYVTRLSFWHTQRTPPSWEITTATDPGNAPASR